MAHFRKWADGGSGDGDSGDGGAASDVGWTIDEEGVVVPGESALAQAEENCRLSIDLGLVEETNLDACLIDTVYLRDDCPIPALTEPGCGYHEISGFFTLVQREGEDWLASFEPGRAGAHWLHQS